MTTTVAKGANRPAAAARSAKAAQRTPLPAKGATQAPGKTNTTAAVIKDELAKPAAKRAPRRTKRPTYSAEDAMSAQAKVGEAEARKATEQAKAKPQVERTTPHQKAAALVQYAQEHGWTAGAEKGEQAGDLVTFKAVREGEQVTLHWITGGTRPGTHTNGGRQVQAMNAATVRRIIDASPEAAAQVRAAYASGSGRAKRAAVRIATAAPLPFDVDTATEDEIVAAVMNRTVTWTNGISGSSEAAVVTGKGKNAPKVTGEGNARALTFWAKGEGSRSVRLLSLVSVS